MTLFGKYYRLRPLLVRVLAVTLVSAAFLGVWTVLFRVETPPTARESLTLEDITTRYFYYHTAASNKKVALTFDDGPFPQKTLEIADLLERNNIPATYFFTGSNVLRYPDVVREVHERGYLIGNHSYSHALTVHESPERLEKELNATSYLIAAITGEVPLYYRPPFLLGVGTDATINPEVPLSEDMAWVVEAGYVPVGIDIDTHDWAFSEERDVLSGVKAGAGGHIVLIHDDRIELHTLQALIDKFKADGYQFVSLDTLLEPPKTFAIERALVPGATDATTDNDVSLLQWHLFTLNYLTPYDITGTFDEVTKDAVTRYQVDKGVVDPHSLNSNYVVSLDAATRAALTLDVQGLSEPKSLLNPTLWERGAIYALGSLSAVLSSLVFFAFCLVFIRIVLLVPLSILGLFGERMRSVLAARHSVTVIVPAFNEEENIAATIKSLSRTEYDKFEIMVVNDGSTDRTEERALKAAKAYTHVPVRVITQVNRGKAAAINRGMRESHSEVIVVMDGDSVFTPQTIPNLVRHFNDPTVAAVAGKVYPVGRKSLLLYMQTLEYLVGQNIDKRGLGVINAIPVVPGPVGAWRKRDVLEQGGFTNETLVEDQDMTLALLASGKRVLYEPKAIAYTEAPLEVGEFLRQRYRWIFGSYQCFGKYLYILLGLRQQNGSSPYPRANILTALGNTFLYGVLLPLLYPVLDGLLIWAMITGSWETVALPIALFTLIDMAYASLAMMREKSALGPIAVVPLVRLVYRQLLLYVVVKSLITWIEGAALGWMKLKKSGEADRHLAATPS